MVNSSQPGEDGSALLPLLLYLRVPSRAKLWCTLQLRGQIHSSYFSSKFLPLWCRLWVSLYTEVWAYLTDMHETRMLKGTGPRNRIQKLRQKWITGSHKEPLVFELWRWNLMICVFCIFLLQAARVKYMWEKIFIGVYCQITWRPSLFPVGLLDAFLILLFGNCSICNLIVWLGGPQQNEDIFFLWRWNLFWQKPIKV